MVLKGIVEEIIYHNLENNYTVAVVNVNEEYITAVGKFPPVNGGECVEMTGDFSKHSKYGEQFSVKNIKLTPPNSIDGIIKYLSSGLIKGVGPITALNIVNTFGTSTLDIIEYNPARLVEIKGISETKAKDIADSFVNIKNMQNVIMFLQEYGISTNMAIKIYNHYGDKSEKILKSNPYKMVEDIDGVGFFTADRIAIKLGIDETSEFRFRAAILHILRENSDKNGNTIIFLQNLIENLLVLLKVEPNILDSKLDSILDRLVIDTFIKKFDKDNNTVIMLTKYYNIEKITAETLKLLNSFVEEKNINIEEDIALYETQNHIKMHEHQKEAVQIAINNGVSIITGGPGTGKTTIVKCILQIFKNMRKKVQLMAPTGRAAKRLSESTGVEALTIHRALEVDFSSLNMFNYNNINKLPYDVIIVDEVSMVDVQLFYFLVRAIRRGAKLILVGDKDQLSSVGAGNVLADILASKKFKSLCLTQIYRQSENSLIITNAHAINNGKMPTFDNNSNDFFFVEMDEPVKLLNTVKDMCISRIPNFLNIDSSKVQVLAPMKAGICGIDNINKTLQDTINPPSLKKAELATEKVIYRVGDRVMQISNNYEREWKKLNGECGTGVFNGDIGNIEIIDINTGECIVIFEDGRRATYLRPELNELILSYAITIHKSQGSEFDAVIIPITTGPPMLLTRNLLYTAVTRAKKMVVLLGNLQTIKIMVKNNYTIKRFTMLKDFLLEDIGLGL